MRNNITVTNRNMKFNDINNSNGHDSRRTLTITITNVSKTIKSNTTISNGSNRNNSNDLAIVLGL